MTDPDEGKNFPSRPEWWRALGWLALAGGVFLAGYGGANAFTAQRENVPSFFFPWESHIPFLPWSILPYWSIDALYVLSFFLCHSREELRRHALRVLLVTAVCVAGFLLFPLRFAFTRPETSGLSGWLFSALETFDQPFNQAPSLHIALLWILWEHYSRRLPPQGKMLAGLWALLIVCSVLTTWQHHCIDVLTGALAGIGVAWLLPVKEFAPPRWHRTGQHSGKKLASRYFLGATGLGGLAVMGGGNGWLLLWPVATLLVVAAGYGFFGPGVFQKNRAGELSPSAWTLLLPFRGGAHLSRLWHSRSLPTVSWITSRLALGGYPSRAKLTKAGFPASGSVLDLTAEFPRAKLPKETVYATLPLLDLLPPTAEEVREAVALLRRLTQAHPHRPIFLHCALGLSRSAVVVAAWLLATRQAVSVEKAVAQIRAARPAVVLHAEHVVALQEWQARAEEKPPLPRRQA